MKSTRTVLMILAFALCSMYTRPQGKSVFDDKYLIVLDVQEYYTNYKLSDISTQNVIDSINYVINKMNRNNVIYIKRIHKVLNLTLSYPFIYISHDTMAMRLDKRLNLVNEYIYTREKPNAFTQKELNDFLKQNNAKEIVMIGFLAEEFLYKSVIKGKKNGYDMYVIPEAIIGRTEKSKNDVITKLTKEGIRILHINE